MGETDSSGDERPLGERKQKLMMKAGFGLSKSHSNSPSNYPAAESQTQTAGTGLADSNTQAGESARSLGQEPSNPDLAAHDEKDGGVANPNQRPRRMSAGSKPQSRTSAPATGGAASSAGRTAAVRDSGAPQAPRGRRAGRGGTRGAAAAGRRGRGRRGR